MTLTEKIHQVTQPLLLEYSTLAANVDPRSGPRRGPCPAVVGFLRCWWQSARSSAALKTDAGMRDSWGLLICAYLLVGLSQVIDLRLVGLSVSFSFGSTGLTRWALSALLARLALLVPRRSEFADLSLFCAALLSLSFACGMGLGTAPSDSWAGVTETWLLPSILTLPFVGVHWSASLALWISGCVLPLMCHGGCSPSGVPAAPMLMGAIGIVAAGAAERNIIKLCMALQLLTEMATDGSGTCASASGELRKVSPRLRRTFGLDVRFAGGHLEDFVLAKDRLSLQQLLREAADQGRTGSVVVAVQHPPASRDRPAADAEQGRHLCQDARIIVYEASGTFCKFCLQILGSPNSATESAWFGLSLESGVSSDPEPHTGQGEQQREGTQEQLQLWQRQPLPPRPAHPIDQHQRPLPSQQQGRQEGPPVGQHVQSQTQAKMQQPPVHSLPIPQRQQQRQQQGSASNRQELTQWQLRQVYGPSGAPGNGHNVHHSSGASVRSERSEPRSVDHGSVMTVSSSNVTQLSGSGSSGPPSRDFATCSEVSFALSAGPRKAEQGTQTEAELGGPTEALPATRGAYATATAKTSGLGRPDPDSSENSFDDMFPPGRVPKFEPASVAAALATDESWEPSAEPVVGCSAADALTSVKDELGADTFSPRTVRAHQVRSLLIDFACTPPSTCTMSLQWAMLHWNIPVSASTCCQWHHALEVAVRLLSMRSGSECKRRWSPLVGWQCSRCQSMNHEDIGACDLCRQGRYAASGGPSPGSDGEISRKASL